MSIDISTAPAPKTKEAVSHNRAHGPVRAKGEQEETKAFASLLSGKAASPFSEEAGHADAEVGAPQAKAAQHGATKWQAREHAQWRVFDAMKKGGEGEAADRPQAEDEEVAALVDGQVRQVAVPFGHPMKAAPAPSERGNAKAGAVAADASLQPERKRSVAGGAPAPHAASGNGRSMPTGARAARDEAAGAPPAPKPAESIPAASEAVLKNAARVPAQVPERQAAANDVRPVSAGPVRAGRDEAADAPAPKPARASSAAETGSGRAARAPERATEHGPEHAAERAPVRAVDREPEREPAGERAAPKVTVMSVQTAPAPAAPAAPGLSPTSAAFVQSLGSAEGIARYASETAMQGGAQNAPKPVTTLRIQLNPIDLGTVTATLSGDGDKLSIEVHVENHEAHHRLHSDGDAIVKALRGMGFDIDRITVQQAPQTGASPGGGANRENAFAAPDQRAGEGRGQSGRQDSGRGYEQGRNQGGSGDRDEARGSGVYI